MQRRRWFLAGGVLVFLVTVGVIIELAVAGIGGPGDADSPDRDTGAAGGSADGGSGDDGDDGDDTHDREGDTGPVPGAAPDDDGTGELPPGADVTERGDGDYRGVGAPGAEAGDPDRGDADTYTYVIEVENGVDTAPFGGGDAFSAAVDATLSDPRSWISTGTFAFRHVSVEDDEQPDLRIRLASPETTREVCGGYIELATSCFIRGDDYGAENSDGAEGQAEAGRVMLNAARWGRGATTFEGDLGAYRQYLINHEVGHGIGYAHHQVCPEDGVLAPVMMQQTLSLNNGDLEDLEAGFEYEGSVREDTCRPNAWPFPHGRSEGEAVDVRDDG